MGLDIFGLYGFETSSLDEQLERAKESPFKVRMDFETRFRVWRDQIIPDRVMMLKKHLDLETAIRYYDLTVRDVVRLYARAQREFMEVADDLKTSQDKLLFHQGLYLTRKNLVYNIHAGFVNDVTDIVEDRR